MLFTNLPTKIDKITFKGNDFFVKRDDLIDKEFSGNKARKLHYLLSSTENKSIKKS